MEMSYEICETEDPDMWNIRFFCNNEICGKLRLGTVEKDALQPKLVELGWTERT